MELVWGVIVMIVSLLAWVGQVLAWLAPGLAVRLSLMESENDVEPVYWADIRGEAMWDALILWTLPLAGLLLILDSSTWAIAGLVGGGAYLYFAGRGILTRFAMQRRGFRIGAPESVRVGMSFLGLWAVVATITLAAAALDVAG